MIKSITTMYTEKPVEYQAERDNLISELNRMRLNEKNKTWRVNNLLFQVDAKSIDINSDITNSNLPDSENLMKKVKELQQDIQYLKDEQNLKEQYNWKHEGAEDESKNNKAKEILNVEHSLVERVLSGVDIDDLMEDNGSDSVDDSVCCEVTANGDPKGKGRRLGKAVYKSSFTMEKEVDSSKKNISETYFCDIFSYFSSVFPPSVSSPCDYSLNCQDFKGASYQDYSFFCQGFREVSQRPQIEKIIESVGLTSALGPSSDDKSTGPGGD